MTVGAFGDLLFYVSSEAVETIDNFKMQGSARFARHQRLNNTTLLEYVGINPSTITFNILLSEYLNADVQGDLSLIEKYEQNGTEWHFVMGQRFYGNHGGLWVITNHSVVGRKYSKTGKIIECDIAITLEESAEE